MKNIGKRVLSLLCAAVMLMSMVAMIVPSVHAEYVSSTSVAKLDELLSNTHTAHYHQYLASDDSVWSNKGSGQVDDPAAAGGKAMLHDWNMAANAAVGTDLTNQENAVKIVWSGDGAAEIGRVNANNVIIDDTYHVYKMTFTVPNSMDDSGFFYLFGTWQVQIKAMPAHLKEWKGQTIDLYLSMKVTGELTAANCYVDRVVIVNSCDPYLNDDGSTCTLCGKTFVEEPLTLTFTADDFTLAYASLNNGDAIVNDPESAVGKAVFVTYAGRAAINDQNMMNNVIFGNGKNMKFHANTGPNDIVAGEITIEELRANMGTGYHTYIFRDVQIMSESDESVFLYFFEDWSIQLKLNDYYDVLKGKTFDFVVSMKITGNVSNREDDAPCYYIDKVILTEGEYVEEHTHAYTGWTYADEINHSGTCSCGDVKTEAHTWDEGVASGNEILYTCSVCSGTKTEAVEEELTLTFTADNFTLAYASLNNGDAIVNDPESAAGKAVFATYAGRAAANDSGMMNAVIFGNGKPMRIYAQTSSGGHQIAEISIEELRANMGNGYFTYVFSDVQILSDTDTSVFLYFFEDWSIQLKLNDYVDVLKGKTVNFVVSMKITGNVSNREGDTPCYYIDKVILTEGEYVEEHTHAYTGWTYADEINHTGTCACGDVKTEAHAWDEGVASGNEILYTCSVCNGTKTEAVEEELTLIFLADDFTRPYGDPIIDDSDSAHGKAAFYSFARRMEIWQANPDAPKPDPFIRVGEQTLDVRTNNNIVVNQFSVDELKENSNAGYVLYKFTDIELTDAAFIYIFDCWGFQVPLTAHKDALSGKKVNVYLSMKITGDVTNRVDNTPDYYIDKVVVTTGTYEAEHTHAYTGWTYTDENTHTGTCACGDVKTEAHAWDEGVASGNEILYTCSVCNGTKTEAVEEELTLIFLADDFTRPYGDPIVDDSDSAHGKAAFYSFARRMEIWQANPDAPKPDPFIRVGEQTLDVRTNNNIVVNQFSVDELKENSNAGYVLYKFADIELTDAAFIYIFDCWGFQVPLTAHKDALSGKKVNVYLSMKITGDVTNRTENTPDYYIDMVVVTTGTYEVDHIHSYTGWTYTDENTHTGTCECGEVKTEAHTWDEGVASGNEILYTCSVCNGTKTEAPEEEEELTLIFTADDFTRPYAAEYGVDPLVIDGDSANGKAVMYSYADRKVIKDANSSAPSHMAMIRVEPQTLDVRTNNNIVVGIYSISELNEISANGGYVLRKFSDIQLTDANFIYIFDCWGFQVPLTQYKDVLRNRTVNVYVSMKITGNVSNTGSKSPVYYIDEVVITTGEYEPSGQTHSYGDWEYMDENNHSASCSHCDDVIIDAHIWDEGVITLKPTEDAEGERTHTCTLCGGTKIEPINKVNPEGINIVFYPDQFFLAYGDPVVNDSSAEGGRAAKFDYAARLATGDKGLYNALIFGGDHMLDVRTNNNVEVGRLPAAKLQKNAEKGKYLTYKFSNINLTGAGFIYLFDCWGLQVKLGEYADILRNEKVYVYVTLKVTGVVGDRENDTPTYYISKIEISSKNRSVDSDQKDPVNMVITASDFAMPYATDSVKSDSQSKYGKAAVFSYEKRLASGDKGLYNAMIFGGSRALELYTHGGDPKQGYLLGSISNERMNYHANKDGYVVYTFKNVKMVPTAGSYLFYMFDCWGMNVPLTEAQVEELQGRRVDISVSMKITGDVKNPNNPPTYYIDYIKIVSSSGSGCVHDYSDWTTVDAKEHTRKCLACNEVQTAEHAWDEGKVVEGLPEGHKQFTCADCGAVSQGEKPGELTEVEPEACEHTEVSGEYSFIDEHQHSFICAACNEVVFAAHTWDEGVVTKEATADEDGEKTYTCSVCNGTKTEKIDKLSGGKEPTNGNSGTDVETPVDASGIVLWAVLVGITDLAAIIFIIFLLKRRKKA